MVKIVDNRDELKAVRAKEGKLVQIAQRELGDGFDVTLHCGTIFINPSKQDTSDYLMVRVAFSKMDVKNASARENAYKLARAYGVCL